MSEDVNDGRREEPNYQGEALLLRGRVTDLEREKAEREEERKKYDNAQLAVNQGQLKTNRRIAFFTFLLVICTAITGAINWRQSTIAKNAAQAAQQAANAASATAEMSYWSWESAQETSAFTIGEMDAQTSAQRSAASAAKKSADTAQSSLRATQRYFEIDQRPYISIIDIAFFDPSDPSHSPHVETEVGKPVRINIVFKNVGKSPAMNVHIWRHILFFPHSNEFGVDPVSAEKGWIGDTLDTGGTTFTTVTSVKNTFAVGDSFMINPDDVIAWDGTPIWIFGRFSYEDRFGNKYCLPFFKEKRTGSAWGGYEKIHVRKTGKTFITQDLCPEELTKEVNP